jgi:hypothetical protein
LVCYVLAAQSTHAISQRNFTGGHRPAGSGAWGGAGRELERNVMAISGAQKAIFLFLDQRLAITRRYRLVFGRPGWPGRPAVWPGGQRTLPSAAQCNNRRQPPAGRLSAERASARPAAPHRAGRTFTKGCSARAGPVCTHAAAAHVRCRVVCSRRVPAP